MSKIGKSYQLTISEISLKAISKKEVYTILSIESGIYLPPISDANQSYLRGILTGKKKYFLSKLWSKCTINRASESERINKLCK